MVATVSEIAVEAGNIIMEYYGEQYKSEMKSERSSDVVTPADLAAEDHIKTRLRDEFDNPQIVAEEEAEHTVDYTRPVWFVDPLDGSMAFDNESEGFSVLIGLYKNGEPYLGVNYLPATHELYCGKKGMQAWVQRDSDREQIHVSSTENLDDAAVQTSEPYSTPDCATRLISQKQLEHDHTVTGGIGVTSMSVARGETDLYFESPRSWKWDLCAVHAIINAAGGRIRHIDGSSVNYEHDDMMLGIPSVITNDSLTDQVGEAIDSSTKEQR